MGALNFIATTIDLRAPGMISDAHAAHVWAGSSRRFWVCLRSACSWPRAFC